MRVRSQQTSPCRFQLRQKPSRFASRFAWLVSGLAIVCTLLPGCADEPPEEQQTGIHLVAAYPSPESIDVPLNPEITLSFNQYLDTEPLRYWNMLSVHSSGIWAGGRAFYDMVDKRVRFQLYRALKPRFQYEIELGDDVFFSVAGEALTVVDPIPFQTGADYIDYPIRDPYPTFTENIEPLLTNNCACHNQPSWRLPPMTRSNLTSTWSVELPERMLVRPFDAPASYLMHKILWDYPIREGTVMPPPWAGELLELDQLRLIERWIRSGARQ